MNYYINKLFRFLKHPYYIGRPLLRLPISKLLPDDIYLKLQYYSTFGRRLDLVNPKTFNEKIQWLKIYDRSPEYLKMVDKYEAKNYVCKKLETDQYIIPTLGVWNSFDEIEFDELPNQFVLKSTHDSGGVVVVKDKSSFDKESARKKLESSMKKNYFWSGREWPYKSITPKIIAEQYIVNLGQDSTNDYKLMCFNGKVKCSFTCSNRFTKEGLCVNFYDKDWNPMPFIRKYPKNPNEIEKPELYDEMVKIAEKLADGLTFVRVDFYECNHKVYFGELTLYPGSGMEWFEPEEWDYELGSWILLPNDGGSKNE